MLGFRGSFLTLLLNVETFCKMSSMYCTSKFRRIAFSVINAYDLPRERLVTIYDSLFLPKKRPKVEKNPRLLCSRPLSCCCGGSKLKYADSGFLFTKKCFYLSIQRQSFVSSGQQNISWQAVNNKVLKNNRAYSCGVQVAKSLNGRSFLKLPPPWLNFYCWAHVTSLTCKANVWWTMTSDTWIDIVCTNQKRIFDRDYTVKSPCWQWTPNLWPSNPDLLCWISNLSKQSSSKHGYLLFGFVNFHLMSTWLVALHIL